MNYFLDTEFLEGPQTKRFLTIPYGKTKPTIDLISIGIVSEDDREYYAISKDFNLREAWDRYQINWDLVTAQNQQGKEYWIREKVLRPIFEELMDKKRAYAYKALSRAGVIIIVDDKFTYGNLRYLIEEYGKSNIEIANEIIEFVYGDCDNLMGLSPLGLAQKHEVSDQSLHPEFYAYYASSDWVAFYQLFGTLMERPKGFPMYCRDLKQMLEEKRWEDGTFPMSQGSSIPSHINGWPEQEDEHNALADARWDKKLFNFLEKL
jgi:hypothetical protein